MLHLIEVQPSDLLLLLALAFPQTVQLRMHDETHGAMYSSIDCTGLVILSLAQ